MNPPWRIGSKFIFAKAEAANIVASCLGSLHVGSRQCVRETCCVRVTIK
jgi:hypothetical protein